MKQHGRLWWYDGGGKYISAKHGILNLIDDCDICIYSLTEKGNTEPTWLIVKVAKAGCMDCYLDDPAVDLGKCGFVMEKIDYKKFSPKNLFRQVSDLSYVAAYNIRKNIGAEFLKKEGLFDKTITAAEFFSQVVEGAGAEIYQRDKAFFVK